MISLFFGIFLSVTLCFQIEAFLFNTKPHCNTRVSVCLTCERPGFYPEMYCNQVTRGDYCFTKIVHNSSGIFTTKGSASSAFCDANKYQGSLAIPACLTGNIQEGTECVDCCKQYNCDPSDIYCNKHIIQDIHMPFTVTTQRTMQTIVTTIIQTTGSSTNSIPSRGGICQVCVEGNRQSCGPASNHYCNKGESYCMNTVFSDPRAGRIVVKKCADEVECKWNYWVDTLGDPKCSNVTGPPEGNVCNYCCDNSDVSVPCNQDRIPKHLSTFEKPQEGNPRATTARPTSTSTAQTTIHDHGHHDTHNHTNNGHHHTDTTTTSASTTTTLPTTTTTPTSAPITCSGNRSVVCEDDPKAQCATLSSFGLCTHLQYNPDSEDIKFCPKTCNLCDKYCEYTLRTVPPATVSPPTFSKTTQRTTTPVVTSSVPITTQYLTFPSTSSQGLRCPSCDENLNCVWNQTCSPEEVCMIRSYPGTKFTTHCSRKEDCVFIMNFIGDGEIFCCNDRKCLNINLGI